MILFYSVYAGQKYVKQAVFYNLGGRSFLWGYFNDTHFLGFFRMGSSKLECYLRQEGLLRSWQFFFSRLSKFPIGLNSLIDEIKQVSE